MSAVEGLEWASNRINGVKRSSLGCNFVMHHPTG